MVPYQQSVAMEAALRGVHVPVKLVRTPGGEHGPDFGAAGMPGAKWPEYFGEMVRWLDEHLKRPGAAGGRSALRNAQHRDPSTRARHDLESATREALLTKGQPTSNEATRTSAGNANHCGPPRHGLARCPSPPGWCALRGSAVRVIAGVASDSRRRGAPRSAGSIRVPTSPSPIFGRQG